MNDVNYTQSSSPIKSDALNNNKSAAAAAAANVTTATNGRQERTLSIGTDEDTCVLCFKNVTYYSIGECDHPVCYECSTRMRVLCQQNECPICRQVLAKVIFANDKLPYRELEAKFRSEFYNKKYKIAFCTEPIQKAFYQLLDHPCPKCNTRPYRTFEGLRNHVRKDHDLHFCDLCSENLKIFTFERRCYTPAELGVHRSKGDADNRSHRGHPLCEYCNKRFLDRDELFRHLRREHFFCHFCEADGVNEFYKDYDSLAEHFRKEHFLCEKGRCATDQFVGAFRTEIDYKAHVANVHGEFLNKQQAKQTRTLQLEITLGPRGRSGQPEANVRSRSTLEEPQDEIIEISAVNLSRPVVIDANNEQDFPSLSGNQGPSVSLARPPPILHRSSQAGLARTKENFPALGGGSNEQPRKTRAQNTPQLASVLKKQQVVVNQKPNNIRSNNLSPGPPLPPPASGSNMILHMSNRAPSSSSSISANQGSSSKHSALDFPALSNNKSVPVASSKKISARAVLEEDMGAAVSLPINNVAAKHRTLVDEYVSVANPVNFQKIQMVQKEELERQAKHNAERKQAPKLSDNNFPSLAGSSKAATNGTWVAGLPSQKKSMQKPTKTTTATMTTKNEKKQKVKKNEAQQKQKENRPDEGVAPPPGFSSLVKPPPGFQSNVTVGSVAKPANNLTFTSSLGESYNILPLHVYMHPQNATARKEKLDRMCQEVLNTEHALKEFCNMSRMFLDGSCKAPYFYDHCRASLQHKFNVIFPELLALLPDINKQQALYLEYKQRLNNMTAEERKSFPRMDVCGKCKQVLMLCDLVDHNKSHAKTNEFPTLKSTGKSSN